MTLDLTFFALGIPAALVAGISKGGFGSGAAFLGGMLLLLILPPATALGIMLPLLILVDLASLKPYWGKWDANDAKRLILAGIPGIIAGAALWSVANTNFLRALIGSVAIAFVVWQIALSRGWVRLGKAGLPAVSAWPLGAAAGFTSFIAHAGGPWTAVYLLSRRPEKTVYQATTVIVFGVQNIVKLGPYIWLGLVTAEALWAALWLAPFALLGTWIGVRLHAAIPQRAFFLVTYALLLLTGVKLISDALA